MDVNYHRLLTRGDPTVPPPLPRRPQRVPRIETPSAPVVSRKPVVDRRPTRERRPALAVTASAGDATHDSLQPRESSRARSTSSILPVGEDIFDLYVSAPNLHESPRAKSTSSLLSAGKDIFDVYDPAPDPAKVESAPHPLRESVRSVFSAENLTARLRHRKRTESVPRTAGTAWDRTSSHCGLSPQDLGVHADAPSAGFSPLTQDRQLSGSRSFELIPPVIMDAQNVSSRPRSSISSQTSLSLAQQIAAEDRRRKTERELSNLRYKESGLMSPPVRPRGDLRSGNRAALLGESLRPTRSGPSLTPDTMIEPQHAPPSPPPPPSPPVPDTIVEQKTLWNPEDPKTIHPAAPRAPDPPEEQLPEPAPAVTQDPAPDEDVYEESLFSDLQQMINALGARTKQQPRPHPTVAELPPSPANRLYELSGFESASTPELDGRSQPRDTLPKIPHHQPLDFDYVELEGSTPTARFELEGDAEAPPPPLPKRPMGQKERLEKEIASRSSGMWKVQQEWDAQQKYDVPIYHHHPS